MMGHLTGAGQLIRLNLRRDRVRLTVWVLALVLSSVATAASFADLYPTEASRQTVAQTMGTPAGIAMSGPDRYLEDYNLGSVMSHQMLGFVVVLVAIMAILTVVRHTRTEESTGRAELIRSTVVGRHAHMTAALGVATVASLGMGGLGVEGSDWAGSLLYGAAHTAVGLVFAGVAALTVQISEHPRGASGMALAVLGLAYVLRAVGDVGNGAVSWLSPIGWSQATYAFVDDRWWPLLLSLAASVVLVAAALKLSTRRDVGAGLRPARGGRPVASELLVRPLGLALRLHRGMLIGFTVGMVLLGVSYGSVLGEVENMISGVDVLEEAVAAMGGANVTESFASMITMVMSIIGSVYVVMATLRANAEEGSGRAEPLLSTALSRTGWLATHLVVAMAGGVAMVAASGLGFGLAAAASMQDAGWIPELLGASLAYVPALWVVAGAAVMVFGLRPQLSILAWAVPVYAFVVGYLGQILQFPAWLNNVSPFGHVPRVPAEVLSWPPLLGLTAVAAGLVAVGLAGFRRRDVGAV
jgi:ABC-2 type transport system permease protein